MEHVRGQHPIESVDDFLERSSGTHEEEYELRWESASLEIWHEILERFPDRLDQVLLNKTLPPELLAELATHEDRQVRYWVATKNRTAPETLALLSADSDESVRSRVAGHKGTPRAVLELMLNDEWDHIREKVSDRLRQRDATD